MSEPTTAPVTAEDLARLFHETYERLAPEHGYETRKASAVQWEDVPAANKSLMIAVAGHVLAALAGDPGDLPARMEARLKAFFDDPQLDSSEEFLAALAAAAMSVRWEHAARQAAEVERLRAELAEANVALNEALNHNDDNCEVVAQRDALQAVWNGWRARLGGSFPRAMVQEMDAALSVPESTEETDR